MQQKPQRLAVDRLHELLIWFFTLVGVLLVFVSFLPDVRPEIRDVLKGFGFSLMPAGVVTMILSRFATKVTESALRDHMEEWRQREIRELSRCLQSGQVETAAVVDEKLTEVLNTLSGLSGLVSAANRLGLEGIYRTRGQALDALVSDIEYEISEAGRGKPARIWIVASSIKGLLEAPSAIFDGEQLMGRVAHSNCDLRVLVTEPSLADLRAKQEGRLAGEIPREVLSNVTYLKHRSIPRDSIRYFPGLPTVFVIATSGKMLLNPYPYRTEAYRCFTLIVRKTTNSDQGIYQQYLEYHCEQPWQMGRPVPLDEWETL